MKPALSDYEALFSLMWNKTNCCHILGSQTKHTTRSVFTRPSALNILSQQVLFTALSVIKMFFFIMEEMTFTTTTFVHW